MTTALMREGEYVRMRGATTTEYAAQVAAVHSPRTIPRRLVESSLLEPTATRPTPRNETAAATQNRFDGRSVPRTSPKSAAKMGMAPSTSPMVEAVVVFSAKTNESWLSQSMTAARASSGRSRRETRSVRSVARAIPTNTSAASPYRTVAYESGSSPCVRMYRVTLRFSAQRRTVASSISSTVDGRRTRSRYRRPLAGPFDTRVRHTRRTSVSRWDRCAEEIQLRQPFALGKDLDAFVAV